MKPTKTIISLTLLTVILLSTGAILVQAPKVLQAKVKFKPGKYTLDTAVPDPWNAEIKIKKLEKKQEIDPASILLEGVYSPLPDLYRKNRKKYIVPFKRNDVLNALLMKLGHVGPGRYKIKLEITGNILDKGKLIPFRGTGHIKLIIPSYQTP